MKTKSSILFIVALSFMLLFISCSNEDVTVLNTTESTEKDNSIEGEGAVLVNLGAQKFTDSLKLEISVPENKNGISNDEPFLLFAFYRSNNNQTDSWLSIPSLQLDNNLKIYYSRSNGNSITLIAEKFDTSEPFGKSLNLKELNVIAVKPSVLSGLTRNDLDIRNYTQMIEHLNLRN